MMVGHELSSRTDTVNWFRHSGDASLHETPESEFRMAVSKSLRFQVLRRDGNKCRYCGVVATEAELTVDHVIPVALGGRDEASNLVTACRPCNSGKSATPPDASLVSDVAEDALRWSQAIKVATERMLADRQARSAEHAQFDRWWSEWTYDESKGQSRPIPKDPGWEQSISRFLAAGLPMPMLKDCLEIAMTRRKISADDTWRYFCGVAWKEVTKLQEAARSVLGVVPAGPSRTVRETDDFRRGRYDAAHELLANLDEEQQERHRSDAREFAENPSDAIECEVDAAQYAFTGAIYDLARMQRAAESLLDLLPADEVGSWKKRALQEIKTYAGDDFTEYDVIVHTVRMGEKSRQVNDALDYLEQLPRAETAEWMACISTLLGDGADGWDITLRAADYAQKNKADRTVLPGLCTSRGDHGAMCPSADAYLMRLENCSGCGDKCSGHPVCERHLEALVDGGVMSRSTGQPLVVIDFKEIKSIP